MFRTFCYRVRERELPGPEKGFAEAVRKAFTTNAKVRRLDHRHIWNSTASRLYDRYTECPDYYLTDVEEEILARTRGHRRLEPDDRGARLRFGAQGGARPPRGAGATAGR